MLIKTKMKPTTTYTEAVSELENILKDLENAENIDMDKISSQIKRASELIAFCKKKLHSLDEEIEKMLDNIDV